MNKTKMLKGIDTSIKSGTIVNQTIKILCARHRDVYLKESVVGGNRELAKSARHALDTYAFALIRRTFAPYPKEQSDAF